MTLRKSPTGLNAVWHELRKLEERQDQHAGYMHEVLNRLDKLEERLKTLEEGATVSAEQRHIVARTIHDRIDKLDRQIDESAVSFEVDWTATEEKLTKRADKLAEVDRIAMLRINRLEDRIKALEDR